jgi:hypothetical protein
MEAVAALWRSALASRAEQVAALQAALAEARQPDERGQVEELTQILHVYEAMRVANDEALTAAWARAEEAEAEAARLRLAAAAPVEAPPVEKENSAASARPRLALRPHNDNATSPPCAPTSRH